MDSLQKKGSGTPVSPCDTPRSSEKFGRDLRSGDGSGHLSGKNDKDKGVNVQVILRCRPLSEEEARLRTPVVISCNEQRREVSAMQNIANKQIDRTFAFDKVFGPTSQQKDLFNHSISPIVNEVLEDTTARFLHMGRLNGEFPSDAGVIPRSVRQIFDTLEAQCAEYSMKVTFLELYNEEITDLLAPDESKFPDDKSKKPIALMEDGKGGVFVRGLEEEVVRTASEIYKILEKEVYAAREKNGIYIPRDRFLQEEAEKKAMAEKIERMESESESKDKQLGGLQELYNSQQKLSAELSEKLDKTQKKLEETENQLLDLEERYRQAKCTIREKEYLIANLLQSGL
ncbi:hypothetical protein IEQ34_016452 [Dendrobium chrysotoxum]|uniref:Kinesin motor domain-containing protein n=1 Tax=Dendrobium chrysotoxum TaxID=161865 RepID=A0AAV7GFM0_DENCH|nr:hypothetical protein IEQ34_016452 [Dendrobium chrysotoxum]